MSCVKLIDENSSERINLPTGYYTAETVNLCSKITYTLSGGVSSYLTIRRLEMSAIICFKWSVTEY